MTEKGCCTLPDLDRFACGELDAESSAAIATHASECPTCADQLSNVAANATFLQRLRTGLLWRSAAASTEWPTTSNGQAPARIGSYQIIREIGRGGMGVVYEALQQDPARPVAIKVLNPAHACDSLSAHLFRREIQALSILSHPGIAAIYEAGCTADGQTFLAMELVEGERLLDYLHGRSLSIEEKLALFTRLCDAVGFAHQRGVIHRDLKPSNILVRDQPAIAAPKVLDFGLARIGDQRSSVNGISNTAAQMIGGTLAYMSPEQVRPPFGGAVRNLTRPASQAHTPDSEHWCHEADVRSDVYSLGVLLYEMLTDRLPYPIDPTNVAASARAICLEHPQPPSRQIGMNWPDVDAIVLKALAKNPDQRYQSASALREDIHRAVARLPVAARAPTLAYLLGRMMARHRLLTAMIAALTSMILAFAATVSLLAVGLERQRQAAVTAQRHAEARLADAVDQANFLMDTVVQRLRVTPGGEQVALEIAQDVRAGFAKLTQQHPDNIRVQQRHWESLRLLASLLAARGEGESARDLLEQSHALVERAIRQHPNDREVQFQFGYSLLNLAAMYGPNERERAADCANHAATIFGQLAKQNDLDPRHHRHRAEALGLLATHEFSAGRTDAAEALLAEAIPVAHHALDLEPQGLGHMFTLAGLLQRHAAAALARDEYPQARESLAKALNVADAALLRHPESTQAMELTAAAYQGQAQLESVAGDHEQARRQLARCLSLHESLLRGDPANARWRQRFTQALQIGAQIAERAGDSREAQRLRQRASELQQVGHVE